MVKLKSNQESIFTHHQRREVLYEKIAFISDIHSNLEALNAVLEDIEKGT